MVLATEKQFIRETPSPPWIKALADSVLAEAATYSEAATASVIAAQILKTCPGFTQDQVAELLSLSAQRPGYVGRVANPRFGEPSFIVSELKGWVFEVILWRDLVTAIHEHSVTGAFKVVQGLRLHFTFEYLGVSVLEDVPLTSRGKLSPKHVEILEAGDVREVLPGDDFIHALWPLDKPCMTIVLAKKGAGISRSYAAPAFRFEEELAQGELDSRMPYLRALEKFDQVRLRNEAIPFVLGEISLAATILLLVTFEIDPIDEACWKIVSRVLSERWSQSVIDDIRETCGLDLLFMRALRLRLGAENQIHRFDLAVAFYAGLLPPHLLRHMYSLRKKLQLT